MKTFIKLVLVVGLVAGLIFEVGAPLWSRSAATGAAQDAAEVGARDIFQISDIDQARADAATAAAIRGATLTKFDLRQDGTVQVTVTRPVHSYVLGHISALKNWYNVTATASAVPH